MGSPDDAALRKRVLEAIPQREPFRFVDEILTLDEDRVVGAYTWPPSADFYRGHFPGNPVTPGVLLLECMAQCSVVPMAIHLRNLAGGAGEATPLFTDAAVDFTGLVAPGTRVEVEAEKVYYRRGKLRVEARMRDAEGRIVCSGTLSGMEVRT